MMPIRKDHAMTKTASKSGVTFKTIQYVYMLVCVIIALFPLVWVFLSSFKTNNEILSGGFTMPKSFSFDGYAKALELSPILRFFLNSAIISVISAIVNVLAGAMASYVFARMRFRGRDHFFSFLMLSMVIPVSSLLQPVFQLFTNLGLYDTMTGLIIVYAALNLPTTLLVLRTTFQGIPPNLEEAAYVDGAGFVRTFFQIMMPCAKGGLTSAAVLAFLNNWNEFTFALVLTKSERARTLSLALSYFSSQFSFNYTAMFAAITIAVIPSIVVFTIFQEQVVTCLTAGAVKE